MGLFDVSKTEVINEAVSKTLTDIAISNKTECKSSNKQDFLQEISNIKAGPNCGIRISGVTQDVTQDIKQLCISKNIKESKLQKQFKAKLKQNLKKASQGFELQVLDASMNKTVNKTVDIVETNVDIENLLSCISDQTQNVKQFLNDISNHSCPSFCNTDCGKDCNMEYRRDMCTINIENIMQKGLQKATQNCLADNKNYTEAIQEVDLETDQSIDIAKKGLLGGMWDALGQAGAAGIMALVVICLMSICCPIIISIISSGGVAVTS